MGRQLRDWTGAAAFMGDAAQHGPASAVMNSLPVNQSLPTPPPPSGFNGPRDYMSPQAMPGDAAMYPDRMIGETDEDMPFGRQMSRGVTLAESRQRRMLNPWQTQGAIHGEGQGDADVANQTLPGRPMRNYLGR